MKISQDVAPSRSIIVQQCLHGYDEGHRLLESSCVLPLGAKREMLILSDLSGQSAAVGFHSYLTGYPVAETHFYALSRTWLAPRMKRPGCVWTHTLLVELADLTQFKTLPQLGALLALFKEPSDSDGDVEEIYSDEILVTLPSPASPEDERDGSRVWNQGTPNFKRALLEELYSSSKPIVVQAKTAATVEDLILLFWVRLWPRIRRDFAFCTGVTSPRLRDKTPFDLQVVPPSVVSAFQREMSEVLVLPSDMNDIEASSQEADNADNIWISTALQDIEHLNLALRDFVGLYGADIGARRENFPTLIRLFHLIENANARSVETSLDEQLSVLLEAVAEAFPLPKAASTLKKKAFGVPAPNEVLRVDDGDLVRALTSTPFLSALDMKNLGVQGRVEQLWHSDSRSARKLLLDLAETGQNPLVEDVVTAIANRVNPEQAIELLREMPSLAENFVRYNRSLVHSSSLWSGSVGLQHELFDALTREQLPTEEQKRIAAAIFNADAQALAGEVVARFDVVGVESILEQLEARPRLLSERWQSVLMLHSHVLVSWLRTQIEDEKPAPNLLSVAVAPLLPLFSPRHQSFSSIKSASWLQFWNSLNPQQTRSDELASFFLVTSFSHVQDEWSLLFQVSFQQVHRMLARPEVNHVPWKWLQDVLPSLDYKNWDKCERLRRAAINKFLTCRWPLSDLAHSISDQETLEWLIYTCYNTEDGEKLWAKIHKDVRHGKISVPEWQKPLWSQNQKGIKGLFKRLSKRG